MSSFVLSSTHRNRRKVSMATAQKDLAALRESFLTTGKTGSISTLILRWVKFPWKLQVCRQAAGFAVTLVTEWLQSVEDLGVLEHLINWAHSICSKPQLEPCRSQNRDLIARSFARDLGLVARTRILAILRQASDPSEMMDLIGRLEAWSNQVLSHDDCSQSSRRVAQDLLSEIRRLRAGSEDPSFGGCTPSRTLHEVQELLF